MPQVAASLPALARNTSREEDCLIPVLGGRLAGLLVKPHREPRGAVVIGVVGTGTRITSANRFVASTFARAGLTALVVELLTEEEDARPDRARDNLPRLAERLCDASEWLAFHTGETEGGVGLVGMGLAGAAALVAAAAQPDLARALVCAAAPLERAGTAVLLSQTPTLVVVGDQDRKGLATCGHMVPSLRCEHRLEVIAGAGPRFVEPGALDQLVRCATAWLRERVTLPALAT